MNTADLIQQLPFWDKLSKNEKTMVQENAILARYEKGQLIQSSEVDCLGMIMVKSGELRIYIVSEEGREITLFRLLAGDCCFLSASCIVEEITFDTQVAAAEECELLVLRTPVLRRLTEANIYARCYMYEVLCKRFSSVMWTIQMILFKGYDRRLADYLVSECDRTGQTKIRATHEQIAERTNSAREVVTRMLRRFASEGWVTLQRGAIQVTSLDSLRRLQ